jgi:hypothetical protein
MEEILIFLIQVVLELFINIPWDLFWYGEPGEDAGKSRSFWIGFGAYGAV